MPSVRGRKRFPSLTRGELAQMLPAGLQRDGTNVVTKDPNREVQERLSLVFASFLELGSVARVIRSFRDRALTVPRRDQFGDVVWRSEPITKRGQIHFRQAS
jgi:hypothetical protein